MLNLSPPENFSLRKWVARLVLLGVLVLVGMQLGAQAKTEKVIRVLNGSGDEIVQVEVRWVGGKAGWKRLAPGQQIETTARIRSLTGVEFSFRDERGIPKNFAREEALDPGLEGSLQIRLANDGRVHWVTLRGAPGSR